MKKIIFSILFCLSYYISNALIYVRLHTYATWVGWTQSCVRGSWYCWEIINVPSPLGIRDYIEINAETNTITFAIDNNINTEYHKQFINNNNFNFPIDTYLSADVVNAEIGVSKKIVVKSGNYNFTLNEQDNIIRITAPFNFVD